MKKNLYEKRTIIFTSCIVAYFKKYIVLLQKILMHSYKQKQIYPKDVTLKTL